MKPLFLTIALFLSLMTFSQEVKTTTKAFTYTTEVTAIGKGTLTTNWVTIKGEKEPIYVGAKGGHYYIVKTKDGEYSRKYIKVN